MAAFGELMTELRQDRGLTQRELGKILSVSTGTISNYENGVHYPDLEKLVQLADYFHVSTDYLLGRLEYIRGSKCVQSYYIQDEILRKIIQSLLQLHPEDRRLALALIIADIARGYASSNEGDSK